LTSSGSSSKGLATTSAEKLSLIYVLNFSKSSGFSGHKYQGRTIFFSESLNSKTIHF